jgi:hypothetical protein
MVNIKGWKEPRMGPIMGVELETMDEVTETGMIGALPLFLNGGSLDRALPQDRGSPINKIGAVSSGEMCFRHSPAIWKVNNTAVEAGSSRVRWAESRSSPHSRKQGFTSKPQEGQLDGKGKVDWTQVSAKKAQFTRSGHQLSDT